MAVTKLYKKTSLAGLYEIRYLALPHALFLLLALSSACTTSSDMSTSTNTTSLTSRSGNPLTAGAALHISNITSTSATLSWDAASSKNTSASKLQYKVVRAASSSAIDTIDKADAI